METEAKEEEGIIAGNLVFDFCIVKKEGTEEQKQQLEQTRVLEREREGARLPGRSMYWKEMDP